ncbi:MAG: hypothetical protein JJU02_12960 [Cryomorphaceae bacterium]|nr:hypothetical protein [Cryomorphaceae bacterium]
MPDPTNLIISEFELDDNRIIRGRVVRMVPNQYYDVRLANRKIMRVWERNVVKKHKTTPDMRENHRFYDIGLAGLTSMVNMGNSLSGFITLRPSYEFGKKKQFHAFYGFGFGTHLTGELPPFSTEQREILSTGLIQAGFGYTANRMEKYSQSFNLGASYFYGGYSNVFGFLEVNFPINIHPNALLVPWFSYQHPIREGIDEPMFFFGFKLRLYLPSIATFKL